MLSITFVQSITCINSFLFLRGEQDAHRMLSQVHSDKNKVEVYDRAEPALMLRNLAMSTSVQFPSDNVSFVEASFGKQKVRIPIYIET